MNDETDGLAEPMHAFLDAVAARRPTPGGGSVAAAAGALAAAMARMVAAYSPSRGSDPATASVVKRAAAELAEADAMLRRLVNEDAAAYQAYAEARKSGDARQQAEATAVALAVPLEIAVVACSTLRVMERHKDAWNPNLVSDLGVAAVLAEACVRAAAYNVRINLRHAPEADPMGETRRELDAISTRAAELCQSVVGFMEPQL